MGEELKPCPFCGGEVRRFFDLCTCRMMFVCKECGANVRFYNEDEFDTKQGPEATEAWNRRAENA